MKLVQVAKGVSRTAGELKHCVLLGPTSDSDWWEGNSGGPDRKELYDLVWEAFADNPKAYAWKGSSIVSRLTKAGNDGFHFIDSESNRDILCTAMKYIYEIANLVEPA